jgi:SNF2 family DNA or RNA helicase
MKNIRLYAYQKRGVEWMLSREWTTDRHGICGGILADEMGLGKTIQSLAVMEAHPQRTLVVCPVSVMHQWYEECVKFTDIEPLMINVTNVRKELSSGDPNPEYVSVHAIETARLVIASHSCFNNPAAVSDSNLDDHSLLKAHFERVIFDEAHTLKNPKTNTFWYATQISAPIRWCLTGTPVTTKKIPPNQPGTAVRHHKSEDIDALVTFLLGNNAQRSRAKAIAKIKQYRMKLILRRTKQSVAEEVERLRLPPAIMQLKMLDFYPSGLQQYASLYRTGRILTGQIQNGVISGYTHILAIITKLRQECSNTPAKFDALAECFDDHLPGARSLVFCNFLEEMDSVVECLEPRVDRVMRYYGEMNAAQKDDVVKTFMDTRDPRLMAESMCLVIQIRAGSVGLNLQAAQHVYIMSPHWSAASELQAISRAHRTKTAHCVRVTRFVMKNTIEEYMHLRQQAKLDTAAHFLDDPEISDALVASDGSTVTWEDVQNLFECEVFDQVHM